jgi:uncharacterized membrane protein YgdD (TMEM256/DUF423 family)
MNKAALLRWALPLAALFGLSGVGMAAYASHGLGFIADAALREAARASLQQAVLQQMLHAPVLVSLGFWGAYCAQTGRAVPLSLLCAAALFALGVLLFSGLIYLRVLTGFVGFNSLVPAGGMALMAGWLALFAAAWGLRNASLADLQP